MNDHTLAIFLLYLFYGAAFFAIGVAVISRLKTFAKLRIGGLFWLLALFAFSHALHEWLEMFLFLEMAEPQLAVSVRRVSLLLLMVSFILLAFFAINLHRVLKRRSLPWLLGLLALPIALFGWTLYRHGLFNGHDCQDFLQVVDYSIRKFIAIPATLLTGSALILYARRLRALSRRGAGNFTGAGLAFLLYGVFTGVMTSDTTVLQLPIQFWRGISAFIILHFIMHALHLFLEEREAQINERLQRAAQAEKLGALGRLAAGIAHEINNPLANASLQLELLGKDPGVTALPDKARQRLQAIERSVEKSARIAGELLLLADRRQEISEYEAVPLRSVLSAAWDEVARSDDKHRLINQLPASLTVYGLSLKLEQLFRNLLLNALDAMPDGGTITVSGREEEKRLVVELRDQGQGFAVEKGHLLLEPFFTTKEVGKGTGLGLAICHGVMAQHNGSLEITPQKKGQGVTVTLVFPKKGRAGEG